MKPAAPRGRVGLLLAVLTMSALSALPRSARRPAPAQDPAPAAPLPVVPASIVCIPRALEPAGQGGASSILHLGVRNPLEVAVEPLSFRLFLPGAPERELLVARVPLPHVGRRGRPVAPGAREEYALALPGVPDDVRDVRAVVETAAFFAGEPAATALPRVSGVAPRPDRDVVQLENTSSYPVDVVLEATYGPERTRSLHAVRLAPGPPIAWDVRPPTGWSSVDGTRAPRALEVRAVDACALIEGADGAADATARAALLEATAGWYGERTVPDGAVGLFEFDHRAGGRVFHARGRFEVVGDGIQVAPLAAWDRPLEGRLAVAALESLFHLNERRPPLEDLVDRASPRRVAVSAVETILAVGPLPALGVETPALLGLRAGRIAWTSAPDLGAPPLARWRTQPFGPGYVRVGLDRYEDRAVDPLRPDRIERWSFEEVAGPRGSLRPLPVELRRREQDGRGKVGSSTRLAVAYLGDEDRRPSLHARDDAVAHEELREAWERPIRYAGPQTWRVRCEVIAPAPREVWKGRGWISGGLVIEGLRAGGWLRADFEPVDVAARRPPTPEEAAEETAGESLGREQAAGDAGELDGGKRRAPALPPLDGAARRAAADELEERLAAWTRLDFAHRPPFELLFEGAIVQRLGADLVIEGCAIRRVRLEDGLPVQVIEADGTRTDIAYVPSPDGVLPVGVQRRGRQVEVEHVRVGDQWLPRRLVLFDFPPVGGLETILFEDWRAR